LRPPLVRSVRGGPGEAVVGGEDRGLDAVAGSDLGEDATDVGFDSPRMSGEVGEVFLAEGDPGDGHVVLQV
jgi:hypothetical protein